MEDEPLPSKYLLAPPRPSCLAGRRRDKEEGRWAPRLRKSQATLWKQATLPMKSGEISLPLLTGLDSDLVCGGSEGLWGLEFRPWQCQRPCSHSLRKLPVTPPWMLEQLAGEEEPWGRKAASVDPSHVSKAIRSWEATRSHLTSPLTQLASGCCLGFLMCKITLIKLTGISMRIKQDSIKKSQKSWGIWVIL